jgi:hypothetical protein
MPIRHEECMFCGEAPCQCSKTKKVASKKRPAKKAVKKVAPEPVVKKHPPVRTIDHDMNSAIRKFHHFGMLSKQEVAKHRDQLGPEKPLGLLREHLHGDEE